jgi:CheY-like chemotaxis protein
MNILIIEENESLGKVLEKVFRDKGHEVTWLRDGLEGLNQLRVSMPDLVLLDTELPSLTGFEILEIRQKEQEILRVPVIVISNSNDAAEFTRLANLDVTDHVIKVAMTPEEVYEKAQKVLGTEDEDNTQKELIVGNATASANKIDLDGVTILWIEDDTFLASIVGRKLTPTGAKYMQSKTAEEAYTLLESDIPHVIVLDLMLPGVNGYEILEKIKADEKTKNIPVIILSNLDQRDDMEKCFKLGAQKFFVKALVTLDHIFEEIKAIVKK